MIYFYVLLLIGLSLTKDSDVIQCTNSDGNNTEKYIDKQGECNEKGKVICYSKYTTYPEDSEVKCNYERKRQIKALLLELLVTYGAGHFYMENYKYAIPKLIVFIFLYYLFIVLRVVSKAREENKTVNLSISISAIVCFLGMIAWQIVDVIKFAKDDYKDGNGIRMYSMK